MLARRATMAVCERRSRKSVRPRFLLAFAMLLCAVALISPPAVSADEVAHPSTPIEKSSTFQTTASPEQELADKYVPILYLRQLNNNVCNTENEGFDPVSVDFVLGQANIPLMDTENGRSTGVRRTIAESPGAADLHGMDQPHFLNFPGSPVRPRCTYRRDFANRLAAGDVQHVAYAHIYHEPGTDELALQYWFFYYFNDWNNEHEGDWEMIMLFFDATTVEEALSQEPTRAVYAQHGGGERADWDADKLSKVDGHPVVYVARGAHASFYEEHTFLGLAENGTGFGCETTEGPHRRIEPAAVVVPHEPAGPDDPFAWLAFTGRWGEFRRSEWNGPTGPNTKTSWTAPVSWADGVRDTSLIVPAFEGFGQSPVGFICGVIGGGSRVLVAFAQAPMLGLGGVGVVLLAVGWTYSTASRTVRQSYAYYRQHLRTFGVIGAVLVPTGYVVAALQLLLFKIPPVEPFLSIMQRFPGIRILLVLALGSAQAVLAVLFVAPTVIWTMSRIRQGNVPGVVEAYRYGVGAIVPILEARLRVLYRVVRRALTIVGLPNAIRQIIQASFIAQAVVHEGDEAESSIRDSTRAANVDLSRTILTQVVLTLIVLLTGPLVAIVVLLAVPSRPLELINFISSFMFAFLYPLAVIGMTLLYFELRPATNEVEP